MKTALLHQLHPFDLQPPRGIGGIEGDFDGIGHAMIWYPKDAENRYWRITAPEQDIADNMVAAIAPCACDATTYVVAVVVDGMYWWLVSSSGTRDEIFARAVAEGATHYRFDEEPGCPAHMTFFRYNEQGIVEARQATEYQDICWGIDLWDAWESLWDDISSIPAWAEPVSSAINETKR